MLCAIHPTIWIYWNTEVFEKSKPNMINKTVFLNSKNWSSSCNERKQLDWLRNMRMWTVIRRAEKHFCTAENRMTFKSNRQRLGYWICQLKKFKLLWLPYSYIVAYFKQIQPEDLTQSLTYILSKNSIVYLSALASKRIIQKWF